MREPVRSGSELELVVRVTPRKGLHVYAPGEKRYKPVVLTIDGGDGVCAGKPVFPPAAWGTFEGERVRVYSGRFEIRQPVQLPPSRTGALTVRGTLEYQACDDVMCYLPVKVPLRWDLAVR